MSYGADPKGMLDLEKFKNGFIRVDKFNGIFYESYFIKLIREALELPEETEMPEGCSIRCRVKWVKPECWVIHEENGYGESHLHCERNACYHVDSIFWQNLNCPLNFMTRLSERLGLDSDRYAMKPKREKGV